MEPEILFRGKRLDNGEWTYGFVIHAQEDNSWGITNEAEYLHDVDGHTVGRYTGLIDKNRKKIFEGDIVRFTYMRNRDSMHQVIYEGWRWNLSNFYETGYDCPCCGFSEGTGCMEIIGNIHDNPELLGGAE